MTLDKVHAAVAQPVEIFLVFDLLGDDAELHFARQLDHRRDHFLVNFVGLPVTQDLSHRLAA